MASQILRHDPVHRHELADLARQMLAERRLREQEFGWDLCAEPAWSILLAVFVADSAGEPLSVSEVYRDAAVSYTTSWRALATLEAKGQVRKVSDPADARRSFVTLTPAATASMTAYLAEIERGRAGFLALGLL